jgi:hypothetical protein
VENQPARLFLEWPGNYNASQLLKNATEPKKTNTFTPLRHSTKHSLDVSCIMDSSGEPVSKYRNRSLFRGVRNISCFQERQPTWDTAHSFLISTLDGGSLWRIEPQGISCKSLPMPNRSSCSLVKAKADCPLGRFLMPTL